MGVIVAGGGGGIDLSAVTATPADVAEGKMFYSDDGTLSTGELWLPNGNSQLYTVDIYYGIGGSTIYSNLSINFIRINNGQLAVNSSALTYYQYGGDSYYTQGFYCPESTIVMINAGASYTGNTRGYIKLYKGNASNGELLQEKTYYWCYNMYLYYKIQ